MSSAWPYLAAIIPSAGVGFLFWLVIKNMMEGDRKERLAHSQWEKQQQAGQEGVQTKDEDSPQS